MTVTIEFYPGIELSPGGSRAYFVMRYFDYLRGKCHLLARDTYFRNKVQIDVSSPLCVLNLSSISSGTFKILLSHLDALVASRDLDGFNCEFGDLSNDKFIEIIADASDKIQKTLELRNQMICKMEQAHLVVLAAKTIFLRAFWRDVLEPAYEKAFQNKEILESYSKGEDEYSEDFENYHYQGISSMMKIGYEWLKCHGLRREINDVLMDLSSGVLNESFFYQDPLITAHLAQRGVRK